MGSQQQHYLIFLILFLLSCPLSLLLSLLPPCGTPLREGRPRVVRIAGTEILHWVGGILGFGRGDDEIRERSSW
jgi:hypothetical protein